ncbi:MAG: AAA family ATPase, partial [Armatimonadetes bacterium]|nr:AAA family ATPase [Anaerolineae bacterium]
LAVISADVDLTPLTDLLVTPEDKSSPLPPIIQRLLAKQPAERYQDAAQVLLDFSAALRQPAPPQSVAIRESFLQAAKFVGRQAEYTQLTAALEHVIEASAHPTSVVDTALGEAVGGIWLVGGESGVGKSRLLDELRAQALVRGAQVLRGQATRERGTPYVLWSEALRWLCLLDAGVSDLEISTLKELIPDLEALLGRYAPSIPLLDPLATQERLLSVTEALFTRQQQPLLVILEDLHWASAENLAVLNRLKRRLARTPLMIVASYRDDERPNLPSEVPGAQLLKLKRLARPDIAELSASMLGASALKPQVLDLLHRESEGNIFFLVEIARVLAESAGRLDRIGESTLPRQVFAGGVQQVILRRLARLPASAHPLLRVAAINGRELDLPLLAAVAQPALREAELQAWLLVCANAAVLEVVEGEWRFTHDKLREGLVAGISADELQALHRRVGSTLEQVYPDKPAYIPMLAHHWALADDPVKAQHYTWLAGRAAAKTGAHAAALPLLHQALSLAQRLAIASITQAEIHARLGASYYAISRLDQGRIQYEQALALVGHPLPDNGLPIALALSRQIMLQIWRRVRTSYLMPLRPRPLTPAETMIGYANYLAVILYLTNVTWQALYLTFKIINQMEPGGPSAEIAWAYVSVGFGAGVLGLHSVARAYIDLAIATSRGTGDLDSITTTLQIALLYYTGLGEWATAKAMTSEAIALADQFGNWHRIADCLVYKAEQAYYQGQFAQALESYQQVMNAAQRSGSPLQQLWAELGFGMVALRLGDTETALNHLHSSILLMATMDQTRSNIVAMALMALTHLRMGDYDAAEGAAKQAEALLVATIDRPNSYFLFDGYVGITTVYLTLWEQHPIDVMRKQQAQAAIKRLRAYARVFSIGQPRYTLCAGWSQSIEGNQEQALKLWLNSIMQAETMGMPYEAALAHQMIAQHLPAEDARRNAHFQRAAVRFAQVGALVDAVAMTGLAGAGV